MFNFVAAVVIALSSVAVVAVGSEDVVGNMSKPTVSDGLFTLATTGWADDYAAEVGGLAFDETGGKPGAFDYALPVDLTVARDLVASLGGGQFLAPHVAVSPNGDLTLMIAPHTFIDGMLMKGANDRKDSFVVISDGVATLYDYSKDIAKTDG